MIRAVDDKIYLSNGMSKVIGDVEINRDTMDKAIDKHYQTVDLTYSDMMFDVDEIDEMSSKARVIVGPSCALKIKSGGRNTLIKNWMGSKVKTVRIDHNFVEDIKEVMGLLNGAGSLEIIEGEHYKCYISICHTMKIKDKVKISKYAIKKYGYSREARKLRKITNGFICGIPVKIEDKEDIFEDA